MTFSYTVYAHRQIFAYKLKLHKEKIVLNFSYIPYNDTYVSFSMLCSSCSITSVVNMISVTLCLVWIRLVSYMVLVGVASYKFSFLFFLSLVSHCD